MGREPKPLCGSSLPLTWIDTGTLNRTRSPQPGPTGGLALSKEEQELLTDISQMVLDLTGIIDPTPISDGSNALISIGRGDWLGAGLSGISLIPYVGDLAKAGKLGRWSRTIEATIALARKNGYFANQVRPILRRLGNILDQVPLSMLPDSARLSLKRIKRELDTISGASRVGRSAIGRYLKTWERYIDNIQIPSPGKDRGVLWSRLENGAEEAARHAGVNKVTLEQSLGPSKFIEKYDIAVAQLTELLGESEQTSKIIWEQFGQQVWKKLSLKYAKSLEGKVTAYVRFDGARGLHSKSGIDAIIWDEAFEISEAMEQAPRVTAVVFKDVVSGDTKVMLRDEVLRAVKSSH